MIHIRKATQNDKPHIARIWRQHTDMLGGVFMQSINKGIASKQLHVAVIDGVVVGFVEYHTRRDTVSVIYHIAVDREYAGQNIGRWLVWSVPCPIQLKVTADNERAIAFYEHLHFTRIAEERAKTGRALYVYRLNVFFIQIAGNNKRFPDVCQQAGIGYGSRHDDTPTAQPYMLDINWKSYEWSDYLDKLRLHKPVFAMVPDYEHPSQRRQLYQQIREVKQAGVLTVLVCPKFDGAIAHIPAFCRVAVSVPSKYAGYVPRLSDLKGRRVHLLGGSPHKQREYLLKIEGAGGVVSSADGNSHAATARHGGWFNGSVWEYSKKGIPLDYYGHTQQSAINITRMLNRIEYKQLALF